ncbi:hypothetical protein CMEL01_08136, partial [Colletotrichum melonis]
PSGRKLTRKLSIIPPPIDRSNQVSFQPRSTSTLIAAATLREASEAQLNVKIPAQDSTNCAQTNLQTWLRFNDSPNSPAVRKPASKDSEALNYK